MVRLPGANMAPLIKSWTGCHTRVENKGANGPIMGQISDDKFTEAASFDRHYYVDRSIGGGVRLICHSKGQSRAQRLSEKGI
jgi:hypothetical protein